MILMDVRGGKQELWGYWKSLSLAMAYACARTGGVTFWRGFVNWKKKWGKKNSRVLRA
jgi:hypothetical protein